MRKYVPVKDLPPEFIKFLVMREGSQKAFFTVPRYSPAYQASRRQLLNMIAEELSSKFVSVVNHYSPGPDYDYCGSVAVNLDLHTIYIDQITDALILRQEMNVVFWDVYKFAEEMGDRLSRVTYAELGSWKSQERAKNISSSILHTVGLSLTVLAGFSLFQPKTSDAKKSQQSEAYRATI